MLKDFSFIVKCNDGPSIKIDVVAESFEKAKEYVKDMYPTRWTMYADDRYNKWSIKED